MEDAGGIEKLMASSEHSKMAFLDLMLDMMNKVCDPFQHNAKIFTFRAN